MRPLRLELSGFSSFRDEAVVDFEDADLFVLVGPTGSGKSSIIDAICFALYGSVPRLDKSKVGPVITKGSNEAKVRLDFEVDGKTYSAVRVVRRTGADTGTTKEARLECDGEVLAGTEKELTQRVVELIGLEFDHFTRCVVLPQGEFAEFLHAKPEERREMLIKLLGLSIYDRMMQMAKKRAAEKKEQVDRLEGALGELTEASPALVKEAEARLARVQKVRSTVVAGMPRIDELNARVTEAEAKVTTLEAHADLLADLKLPEEVERLSDELELARKDIEQATAALDDAGTALKNALARRKDLPDRTPLTIALKAHDERSEVEAKLKAAQESLRAGDTELQKAVKEVTKSEAALEKARAEQDAVRQANLAVVLAADLAAGEPCPVCLQEVHTVPHHDEPAALAEAEAATADAAAAVRDAQSAAKQAEIAQKTQARDVELHEERIARLDEEIAGHPDRAAIESALADIAAAEAAEATARDRDAEARAALAEAQETSSKLQEREASERERFGGTRDALAGLGPPPVSGRDLVADWEALQSWSGTRAKALAKELAAAEKDAAKLRSERSGLIDDLLTACRDCDIEADGEDVLVPVEQAVARAEDAAAAAKEALARAKAVKRDLKTAEAERALLADLGQHLSGTGFKQWIVDEALETLVQGATQVLRQLSNEQYSVAVDDKGSFLVIDHTNADERRSVKTLSGGETFQISLALALALSDQLMELSTEGSARLDALFLDEGFGTLDPDRLDAVAAAMENLASEGRMVGLVTHVRELADGIRLQFQVKKDLRTSTVERVER